MKMELWMKQHGANLKIGLAKEIRTSFLSHFHISISELTSRFDSTYHFFVHHVVSMYALCSTGKNELGIWNEFLKKKKEESCFCSCVFGFPYLS